MLFSSIEFLWFFLPIVLAAHWLIGKDKRNGFLLFVSLIFYAWGEPRYIFLMILSILMNWGCGLAVAAAEGARRKLAVALCVILNLALLGYFKYANFFVDSVNGMFPETIRGFARIALPIGISFYTFQAMSYVIDVYRRDCEVQKSPFRLGLYIALFPQLIAGPIVKYHDIQLQLDERTITAADFAYGVRRFVLGLAKKVLIANQLAAVADYVFTMPESSLGTAFAWTGALCYTFQIYFDFSGYSDMAIGLGRMLGFRFLENFNYPYLSRSVREFWTRWHISLSTWFKEYLYIPLGGNRRGQGRTYLNLAIVFLATGIWHGAAWTFVFWGIWHGTFILLERAFLGKWLAKPAFTVLSRIYMALMLVCGWVLFRAETLSSGWTFLRRMFTVHGSPYGFSAVCPVPVLVILGLAVILCGPLQALCPKLHAALFDETKVGAWEFLVLPALLFLSMICLVAGTYNPFIYFRF